VFVLVSIILHY